MTKIKYNLLWDGDDNCNAAKHGIISIAVTQMWFVLVVSPMTITTISYKFSLNTDFVYLII